MTLVAHAPPIWVVSDLTILKALLVLVNSTSEKMLEGLIRKQHGYTEGECALDDYIRLKGRNSSELKKMLLAVICLKIHMEST